LTVEEADPLEAHPAAAASGFSAVRIEVAAIAIARPTKSSRAAVTRAGIAGVVSR